MKAWKAALAASVVTAVIAVIVVVPMAASSKSTKGLKIVSEAASGTTHATAKCPKGFTAIAGGFDSQQINVARSEKLDERRWTVRAVTAAKRGQLIQAQVICAKGTGGLQIKDLG